MIFLDMLQVLTSNYNCSLQHQVESNTKSFAWNAHDFKMAKRFKKYGILFFCVCKKDLSCK